MTKPITKPEADDNPWVDLRIRLKQVKAIIGLITREQTLLTGYGDPGRYDLSDLAFFNQIEADLIRALTAKRLADKREELDFTDV